MGFKFPILIAGFCLVTGAVNAEELNAYSIMPEKYASKIFAEFTKDTGIKVNFLRFSSGEALARLTAEKKNPQVDVMLGGPADTYAAGIKEGIFEAYRPKDSDAIPANLRDPGNHWTGIGIIPLCFLTNTKFLEKNGRRRQSGLISSIPAIRTVCRWLTRELPAQLPNVFIRSSR